MILTYCSAKKEMFTPNFALTLPFPMCVTTGMLAYRTQLSLEQEYCYKFHFVILDRHRIMASHGQLLFCGFSRQEHQGQGNVLSSLTSMYTVCLSMMDLSNNYNNCTGCI